MSDQPTRYDELPPPVRTKDLRTSHDVGAHQPPVKSENDLATEVGG